MSPKIFWRGLLVSLLCLSLAVPVRAQFFPPGTKFPSAKGAVIGAAVGVAAIVIILAVVLTHKQKITGCVSGNDSGMSVTDEKEKVAYTLSGNTAGIKAGERVTLQGKKAKSKDKGSAPTWQVDKLTKDLGSCHP